MKVHEQLDPQVIMGMYALIGNSAEVAVKFKELGQDQAHLDILSIGIHYLDKLVQDVEAPKVGIQQVFAVGEKIHFSMVKGRIGYDSKTVTKMLKEALKNKTLQVEGKGRSKTYSIPS